MTAAQRALQETRSSTKRTGQDRTGQDRTGQDRTGQDRTGQFRKSQRESKVPDQRHSGACSALSFHLGLHAGRSRGHRRGSAPCGALFALPRFYGGRMAIFDNSS